MNISESELDIDQIMDQVDSNKSGAIDYTGKKEGIF